MNLLKQQIHPHTQKMSLEATDGSRLQSSVCLQTKQVQGKSRYVSFAFNH
jgi:hypothetical protein